MGSGIERIVQGNNSSIEQIIAEVQRIKQATGQIVNGLNGTFGQVRTQQGIVTIHQQLGDAQRRIGFLETEANRLQTAEIGALKERCKEIENEQLKSNRKLPQFNEQLDKNTNERTELLERKLLKRDHSPRNASQPLMEKVALMKKKSREGGLATEQSGQHELIREVQRLQLWVQSLNGVGPQIFGRMKENLESELRRVDRTQFNPIRSNSTCRASSTLFRGKGCESTLPVMLKRPKTQH